MTAPRKDIEGIGYEFRDGGVLRIWQGVDTGNEGDVSVIDVHPVFQRLLAEEAGIVGRPSMGIVPDSMVARLCLIADRMEDLQGELHNLGVQPYYQPWEMGKVVLNDLDQLLEECGYTPAARRERPGPTSLAPPSLGHATPSNASGVHATPAQPVTQSHPRQPVTGDAPSPPVADGSTGSLL